jgi:hypothetical protein
MLGLEWKDIIGIIIIPLVAAAITVLWPVREAKYRRKQFEKLIARELSEAFPNPKQKLPSGKWKQHVNKDFIHKHIFQEPSGSSDLVLSMDENIAYAVKQLWDAYEKDDAERWLFCLGVLEKKYSRLRGLHSAWDGLIKQYGIAEGDSPSARVA